MNLLKIFLTMVILLSGNLVSADDLYVFFPVTTRLRVVKEEFTKALPGTKITVFGRYKDFKTKIKMDAPVAILTKPAVIEQIKGYTIKLKGLRKGSVLEPYVMLSVDQKINPGSLEKISIGVFDILGRRGMKKFIKKYFDPVHGLERVSKMEDLLPLLSFSMAETILIPEYFVNYFKTISKLNFVVTKVKMETGIMGLALKEGNATTALLKKFKVIDQKVNKLMEVDNWK